MENTIRSNPERVKPRVFCYSRYDGAAPFSNHLKSFTDMLESRFSLTSLEDADFFISLDHEPKTFKMVDKAGIPAARRFLIVREPRQVHPYSHSKAVSNDYSKILYMGAVASGGVPHFWPYEIPRDFALNNFDAPRANRAVAIAGWRVSFIRGTLYGLRAKAFSEATVDLFGRDWSASWFVKCKEILANGLVAVRYPKLATLESNQLRYKPANYKGAAVSKFAVLAEYKVSLVIENSLEYFSEKLFDSLVAGAIPVYCGPNPNLLGLPHGLVIWCEPEIKSIRDGIKAAQETDYTQWRQLLDGWLKTFDLDSPIRSERVWRDVVEVLSSRITQSGAENE